MHANSLIGTTVRDLVFLVQDSGCDAAAAEFQLLASHSMLIRSATRPYPSLPNAEAIARDAFRAAIRTFRFSSEASVSNFCWSAMRVALEVAANAKNTPEQLLLVVEPVAVAIKAANLRKLRQVARSQRNDVTHPHFGLSA